MPKLPDIIVTLASGTSVCYEKQPQKAPAKKGVSDLNT